MISERVPSLDSSLSFLILGQRIQVDCPDPALRRLVSANFGMMAVLPFANASLEAPGLGLSADASFGLGDLYVVPAQLGWHLKRADLIAGFGLFAPTGRHTAGASDNLGKGMWSYEISGGGTAYLDAQRSWSVATTAFWEIHSKKDGAIQLTNVRLNDAKVGQLLTLEGGAGKSFLQGAASVGAAYYAQWKVTSDQFVIETLLGNLPNSVREKHRVFGLGPDVTIPIATSSKLISLVNVRYLWEFGAQTKTQGGTFILTYTIPVGGIPIPGRP